MPATPLYDVSQFDFDQPEFPIEEVRKVNPQRFEMEHLTAVVHIDTEKHGVVAYKDVTPDEFWVRGHMPDYPLMPGVIQCEAGAQAAGFYARKTSLLGEGDYFLGFGGMDKVRFKRPVHVGERLTLMIQATTLKKGMLCKFDLQGWVGDDLAFSGSMIGVPIDSTRDGSGKPLSS